MASAKITDMTVQVLTPEEEAAQRLAGTYDPSKLTITASLKLDVPIDFIKVDFLLEPRADHAERLKTCAEFKPGEPAPGNTCQTDGHYLCQECAHITPEKTTAALEEAELAHDAADRLTGDK